MNYKQHTHCRVCGSDRLVKYLDLGELPLTNNLRTTFFDQSDRYPIELMVCLECWLSQLSIVVDPNVMFGNYLYRSSISKDFIKHCKEMAVSLKEEYGLTKDSFHIDIAGNDGALLNEFRSEIGLRVLNIDPAKNLAGICQAREIETLTRFWDYNAAITAEHLHGKADLITATNVFAHVDDVKGFLQAVKAVLKQTGVLVMEFPYLNNTIDENDFNQVYAEHLSYFSVGPLMRLCSITGLKLIKVEHENIHGGSIRVHLVHNGLFKAASRSVLDFIESEERFQKFNVYYDFSVRATSTIREFRDKLFEIKEQSNKICAFAASAKGNTLLNCAAITVATIAYIVDETPGKIGMFSPGTHIPIVSMLELQSNPPDYLVILSWNFFDEIYNKCKAAGYRGKFIVPIPKFKIVE